MPVEDAHRDAFWVVTVVGGMSIVKVIEKSVSAISLLHPGAANAMILLRVFVFLVTAIRFYIGASLFFQAVHIEPGHETRFPRRNYAFDLGSAIFHFALLYLLATNVDAIPVAPFWPSKEAFFLSLCLVLLYDCVWYLASKGYSTRGLIRKWAFYNVVTALCCVAIFVVFKWGRPDGLWFEVSLAAAVFATSIPDYQSLARGELPQTE